MGGCCSLLYVGLWISIQLRLLQGSSRPLGLTPSGQVTVALVRIVPWFSVHPLIPKRRLYSQPRRQAQDLWPPSC
jgi:hypothetical protein